MTYKSAFNLAILNRQKKEYCVLIWKKKTIANYREEKVLCSTFMQCNLFTVTRWNPMWAGDIVFYSSTCIFCILRCFSAQHSNKE